MAFQPLVSSIIIFYNEADFLAEAIESAIAQTYSNWELLLVDDGSTDSSPAIARSYAQRYPDKIRYLTHPNRENWGMSAARNLGVTQAKGDYIAYLDGDDAWKSDKLAAQVELMAAHPAAAMVYGPLIDWYSWQPGATRPDGLYGTGKKGVHPYQNSLVEPPELLTLFLDDEEFIPSGGLIKRAALLDSLADTETDLKGCYEEAFRGGYSDAVAFVKLCLRSPVFVTSQSGYQYRQHPKSSTAVSLLKGEELTEEIVYLNWVQTYLASQPNVVPAVGRALNRALKRALWRDRHPHLLQLRRRAQQLAQQAENRFITLGRKSLPKPLRHWLWVTFKSSPDASPDTSLPPSAPSSTP